MANETKSSSPALVALAWLLVGCPLGWGIYRSGLNAAKLFQRQPQPAVPPTHASLSPFGAAALGYLGMPRVTSNKPGTSASPQQKKHDQ